MAEAMTIETILKGLNCQIVKGHGGTLNTYFLLAESNWLKRLHAHNRCPTRHMEATFAKKS